ncbi:hypothetical protein JNJ66_01190 [Candidatus Saccharibacteria bacterium]|nr:hypothetical protein [Candidatus Saccharibacteria bacterium]
MKKTTMGNRRRLVIMGLALAVLAVGCALAVLYAREAPRLAKRGETPLMVISYTGGMCAGGQTCHSEHAIYEDGTFIGMSRLSPDEVSKLKRLVAETKIPTYKERKQAYCQSYADGLDLSVAFPQRYPGKTYTLCKLDMPIDDPIDTYIGELISNHAN